MVEFTPHRVGLSLATRRRKEAPQTPGARPAPLVSASEARNSRRLDRSTARPSAPPPSGWGGGGGGGGGRLALLWAGGGVGGGGGGGGGGGVGGGRSNLPLRVVALNVYSLVGVMR